MRVLIDLMVSEFLLLVGLAFHVMNRKEIKQIEAVSSRLKKTVHCSGAFLVMLNQPLACRSSLLQALLLSGLLNFQAPHSFLTPPRFPCDFYLWS